jgi:hypothetical protein
VTVLGMLGRSTARRPLSLDPPMGLWLSGRGR